MIMTVSPLNRAKSGKSRTMMIMTVSPLNRAKSGKKPSAHVSDNDDNDDVASDSEVSACHTCIPKGCMMTPTSRDMTVRETYTQCVVLSNKVCSVC